MAAINISVILSSVLVFALYQQICSAGISRFKRDLRVWPASLDTSVYEQQPFLYWCNESRPISACEINFQAWGHTFKLNETARDSVFEYPAGAKFSRGECGIRIFKTVSNMSGAVSCSVLPVNQDADSKSSIFLRVQTPPSRVELFTGNKHFEFKEGESMAFYCSVEGGKPDTMDLLIGDKVVASSNKSHSVSFTKEALFSDHKQKVVCRVHHETFTQPREDRNIIRVSFPPRAADSLDEEGKLKVALNFFRGQNGSISIRINANPKPIQSDWSVGGQEPDQIKYIPWSTLITDGKYWVHGLNINDLSDEDFHAELVFTTSNELGSVSIPVVLTEEKDHLLTYLVASGSLMLVVVLVVAGLIYWKRRFHGKMILPSSKDHKFWLNRSAVATIKGWKSGSHISGLDPEEMEFAVDLMNNSIPGCMCLQYSNFESPELEKIERSCKMLVFILKEGDSYIEVCSNKIKIITMGHNENANELVKFPTLKLSSLDETSKLVIKMHKVSFRGNNLLASDLFEDCIEELRITDILRFKLDESAAEAEQTIYIPQALESTDDARTKYPSTTALVNDIIISRALRHLIVGDAGTGKTQTLLSLEKQFGESLPNYWILLKDLSQCNKLPDLAGDSDNIESVDALRLLFEDVLLQLDPSQRRVLESKVQSGKVVFLLDSFDAVWSRKVNTVRRLINSVCEKGIQVMSTRTYRASDLKGYKTYQIGALDEAELVSQQWIRNKVTKPHSEVRALLKALDPNVTSVPLHLVLSAEYFADHATTQLNLVELFREHIEVALADQHLVRGLLHKLSAYHLFEGENCEKPSDTELDMLRGCRLVKIVGSDAEFKHRPVCEFLFATATMRRMFKQPKPHEDKFKQILLSPERALLRHFMDQMDDEGSTWPKCFQPLEKCTLMAVCLREKLFNLMRILCQGDSVLPDVVQMLVRSDSLVEPENFSQFFAQLEENGKMSKEDKNIALDLAFYAENVELVRVLLDRGADPGVRNSINKAHPLKDSYLHSACALGNLALAQMLAEVLEVESVDGTLGRTPLMQAVDNDCLEVSKYLLEVKNARWDVVDENGDNCLHLAARSSDGRLLQLIVSRASTSVDAVNARGETALLCAVKCGRTANVELLLNQGADVTVRDVDERTALDWATANKCKDIADVLQGK